MARSSVAATRFAPRLAQLSHEQLFEFATRVACASVDSVREADAFLSVHVPLPEWARAVLLSTDLAPQILGMLPTTQHECKATCQAWRRAWEDTLEYRPSELRLSRLAPFVAEGQVMDLVALDAGRLRRG